MDLEIWPDIILMNNSLQSDVPGYVFNKRVYYNVQQQRYSSHIKMFHFKQLQCLYFLHALKSVLTLLTERIKNINKYDVKYKYVVWIEGLNIHMLGINIFTT